MNTNIKEIRDAQFRNKLACIYSPEDGTIEIKLFGCRLMQIKFPPSTPIQFSFRNSNNADTPAA